jgi:L-ascorbate metabolism protein UlaG (beta-lactamase superfamily)
MGNVKLTWNATANLRLEWGGSTIFFDPWFTRNEKAEPRISNTCDSVDEGASIFISHGHFDHLQDVPAILMKKGKVHVYCSRVARCTIEQQLKAIDGFEGSSIRSCLDRVHVIEAGNTIDRAGSEIKVEIIKSAHIKIIRVLFNIDVWKSMKVFRRILKDYPKGDVFGFDVHLGNEGRLVFFGSLCKNYPEILKQHAKPDILVIPIAGRFNCDKIGLEVTRIVSPKIVIPIHQDNFFPPITYRTPVVALKEGAGTLDPPVQYVELPVEKAESIGLG